MTLPPDPVVGSRASTLEEGEAATRAFGVYRTMVWIGTLFFAALGVPMTAFAAKEEGVGVAVLFALLFVAFAGGLWILFRDALSYTPTDRVEPLAGTLTRSGDPRGPDTARIGNHRAIVPGHWRAELPEGASLEAEGVLAAAPDRAPVFFIVAAAASSGAQLSVAREHRAGLRHLYSPWVGLAPSVGSVLFLAGTTAAVLFAGLGSVPPSPTGAWISAAAAAVGAAMLAWSLPPLLRSRGRLDALYHPDRGAPEPSGVSWPIIVWGAIWFALGLWLVDVPPWVGALVGALGLTPAALLAPNRPSGGRSQPDPGSGRPA